MNKAQLVQDGCLKVGAICFPANSSVSNPALSPWQKGDVIPGLIQLIPVFGLDGYDNFRFVFIQYFSVYAFFALKNIFRHVV